MSYCRSNHRSIKEKIKRNIKTCKKYVDIEIADEPIQKVQKPADNITQVYPAIHFNEI